MPTSSNDGRPAVLLLAGAARDAWTRALEAGGFEVSAAGWLDAVTAARLRRPDAVLVSTDLPDNAPQMLCTGFRTSVDLARVPIVVAGPGADRVEQVASAPMRADRYVQTPSDGAGLADSVGEAIRVGRARLIPKPAQRVVNGLLMAALLTVGVRLALVPMDVTMSPTGEWILFAAIVVPFSAAVAVGLLARTRPLSLAERRTTLGWLGLFLWNVGRFVPGGGAVAQWAGVSLGACAFAAWAWLGPAPTPWFTRSRRPFQILAIAFGVLAVAPLVVLVVGALR